jgi:hypothetical protein
VHPRLSLVLNTEQEVVVMEHQIPSLEHRLLMAAAVVVEVVEILLTVQQLFARVIQR